MRAFSRFATMDVPLTATDRAYNLDFVGEPYREVVDPEYVVRIPQTVGRVLELARRKHPIGEIPEKRAKLHAFDPTLLTFGLRVVACQRHRPEAERRRLHASSDGAEVTCVYCKRALELAADRQRIRAFVRQSRARTSETK